MTTPKTLPGKPFISVIIPVRNDTEALGCTLEYLSDLPEMEMVEIIVAASGDCHGTERAAIGRAQLLWPSGSTRSQLMNAGATSARGEVLFFLHADSFPPRHAFALIEHTLADPRVVGGAFEHLFAEPSWSLWVITWINRIRYRLTHNYYGDQGIFVRAATFRQLEGYQDLRLMEDLDFTRRLKHVGRTVVIREPLRTSGRRFLARGPWRTFSFIVWLLLLYTLGFDTQRYAERWRGPAGRPPGSPWRPRRRDATANPPSNGGC
jgi:rSAM/selenodomain-associated transferase 2